MDRCCSLEFPESLTRARTKSSITPRATVCTDSLEPQAPTLVQSKVVETDATASSFEEALASLLVQLHSSVSMQYDIFANRTQGNGGDELQLLHHHFNLQAPRLFADSGDNEALGENGITVRDDNIVEQHVAVPVAKSSGLMAVVGEDATKEDAAGHKQVAALVEPPWSSKASLENDFGTPETKWSGSPLSIGALGQHTPRRLQGKFSKIVEKLRREGNGSVLEGARKFNIDHLPPPRSTKKRQNTRQLRPSRTSSSNLTFSQPSTRTSYRVKELKVLNGVPLEAQENLRLGRRQTSGLKTWLQDELTCDWVFGVFMNFVVISNVVLLGFQAGSAWPGWILVDAVYVVIFAAELAYFVVCGGPSIFLWGNLDWCWNWLDALLLVLTVAEVVWSFDAYQKGRPLTENQMSKFTQLRMLRVARILRILRLSHIEFFKDLGLMVVGMVGGLRTLLWSTVMLLIPVYGVAVYFTETIGTVPNTELTEMFASLRVSMFTTFRCLVLGDCSDRHGRPIFQHVLETFGWDHVLVYCLATVFMSFGLFNVIVAIYVESTMAAARANQALQHKRRLQDNARLSCRLFELVHFIYEEFRLGPDLEDADLQTRLAAEMTNEMFHDVICNPTVRDLLQECDVPEEEFSRLFDICDTDGGGRLSLDEIVSGIRRLRGEPSRSDVVFVMLRIQEVQAEIHGVHQKLDQLVCGTPG